MLFFILFDDFETFYIRLAIPPLMKQRQEDISEFQSNLVYIASSRTARSVDKESASQLLPNFQK